MARKLGAIGHADINIREDIITLLTERGVAHCVWSYFSIPSDGNRFGSVDDYTGKIFSERMLRIINGEELNLE